ncbi:MAG: hypothetical protein IPK81_12200 [Rhodospirillales bacterium]|nr:MAG: hypothetical protein IPK81_12200 [Rhodospirillales bacterium]
MAVAAVALAATGAVSIADARAQSTDQILLELPDKRVVPLGELTAVRGKLASALPAWERVSNWRGRWFTVVAPAAASCPAHIGWTHGDSSAAVGDIFRACEDAVRARLGPADLAVRERCRCVKVLEGRPGDRLRVVDPVLLE